MVGLQSELKQNKPFETPESEAIIGIVRTSELLMRKHSEFLRGHELTPPQYNVLRILRGAGQDGLICREIGERMVTFDPDVTKLLDRLEARELVNRERQQKDRRVITVTLTDRGAELLKEIDGPLLELTRKLLGHVGEARLRELSSVLNEIRCAVANAD